MILAILTNFLTAKSDEYQKHWQNGRNCHLPKNGPAWGQKCPHSEPEQFTFDNFQSNHPVLLESKIRILEQNSSLIHVWNSMKLKTQSRSSTI